MDKILVTGSMGFIGKHLMKALGERGVGFDIKKSPYFDINKPNNFEAVVRANNPSCIIHLAAISSIKECTKDPQFALKTNIIGTYNVLKVAEKYGIRVVLASSAATEQPELSLYGTSKDCMERIARMFDNVFIFRLYNVYGKNGKGVVNKFLKKIQQGKEIKLNGNTIRDYIYIDDVVKVLVQATEVYFDNPVPVGTGKRTSLKKLVSIIEKETGKKAKVKYSQPIKEIQESSCSFVLNKPISLKKGIKLMEGGTTH